MANRCLIVANQTLGGEALDRSVEDCIARGTREFYVVVPMTRVDFESQAWAGGFVPEGGWMPVEATMGAAMEENVRRREAELEESRSRAQQRLELMVEKIESLGGQADGEVGVDDPMEATALVLERQPAFQEIIVSTLPVGLSRWIKMDLPNRIARMTDVPVTTVQAEG